VWAGGGGGGRAPPEGVAAREHGDEGCNQR
jgi:hypothetical protein